MLSIKLKRIGKKHQPAYRVVVSERRSKLHGQHTEDLGWFNPLLNTYEIKKERILHWIKVGAQPTDTIHNLLLRAGIIEGTKRAVHNQSKKKGEASAPAAAQTPAAA
ncbi:MAG: 30S ribosomal protein S16 [Patescibacteria group bacterium]